MRLRTLRRLAWPKNISRTAASASDFSIPWRSRGRHLPPVVHAHAVGYPSGRYGSQNWHRRECGLDASAILLSVAERAAAAPHRP